MHSPAMLVAMERGGTVTTAARDAAATVPWLVLGAVLGIALMALVGSLVLLARRRGDRPAPVPEQDDLPAFLEHPPGTPGAPASVAPGWPALAPVAAAAPDSGAPPRGRGRTLGVLAAVAGTVLLGAGAAAALAAADRESSRDSTTATRSPDPAEEPEGLAARLEFGGVVLERRAVGVTATYPRLEVTSDGTGATASLELPAWNCLTDRAPADPVAAGCTRSLTEFADLTEPDLAVEADGDDGVRLSGRFPTHLRPNGSPPEPTGRAYQLTVTAEPSSPGDDGDWRPADGVFTLGDDHARTTPGSRLRLAG